MALEQVSIAAATAVVDYDLLQDSLFRTSQAARRVAAIGMAGSAAALDTIADLFVGTEKVATLYNSAVGANDRDSMFRVGANVPAGQPIRLIIKDAPSTNPINVAMDLIG